MSERLFREVARLTRIPENYQFEDEGKRMVIKCNSEEMFSIHEDGSLSLRNNVNLTEELQNILQDVRASVNTCKEYVSEMDRADELKATDFNMPYKKIAEFGGVVLAGMELADGNGYNFTTWRYSNNSLYHGNYYTDYKDAKEDFATRSGLIDKNKVFSSKELTEIFRSVSDTLDGEYEITNAQKTMLEEIQGKIKDTVPDLDELIMESNQQEYEQNL